MFKKYRQMRGARARQGFTLVELIVVLVILSLLLSMTVPAMTQWIAKSKIEQAKTECRACVVAAQTLAVEKYSSNRAEDSVDGWISNTSKRSDDITGLAAVRGAVAADGENSGDTEGVTFDMARGYTVTYLKYYYDVANGKYIEYFYPGDLVAGEDDGTNIPHPGTSTASPKPTATPLPTATTPPSGEFYIATTPSTVTTIKLTPYAEAWKNTTDNFPVKTGTCFEYNGKYYYVLCGQSYQKGSTPDQWAGNSNLTVLSGTLYNDPNNPQEYNRTDGSSVNRGDLYYLNGTYYIFDCGTQPKRDVPPPPQSGNWKAISQ